MCFHGSSSLSAYTSNVFVPWRVYFIPDEPLFQVFSTSLGWILKAEALAHSWCACRDKGCGKSVLVASSDSSTQPPGSSYCSLSNLVCQ